MAEKVCYVCGKIKNTDESFKKSDFSKCRAKKDGFHGICKECYAIRYPYKQNPIKRKGLLQEDVLRVERLVTKAYGLDKVSHIKARTRADSVVVPRQMCWSLISGWKKVGNQHIADYYPSSMNSGSMHRTTIIHGKKEILNLMSVDPDTRLIYDTILNTLLNETEL